MSEKEQHEGQIVDAQQDLNKKGRNLFNKQKLGEDLTSTIKDLQKKIDTVGGEMQQTNKLSDKEKTSFLANQKKLEDTNGKIDGKKKQIETAEGVIKQKEGEMGAIDGAIEKLEAEQQQMSLITFISDNPTDIDPVAEINKKIEALKAKKETLKKDIIEQKNIITKVTQEKKALEALLPGIKSDIEKNQAKLKELAEKLEKQKAEENNLITERDDNQREFDALVPEIERDAKEMARISNELIEYHRLYQEHLSLEAQENGENGVPGNKQSIVASLMTDLTDLAFPGFA